MSLPKVQLAKVKGDYIVVEYTGSVGDDQVNDLHTALVRQYGDVDLDVFLALDHNNVLEVELTTTPDVTLQGIVDWINTNLR